MVDEKDVHGLRFARSEFSRRCIDISRADVRMMHGVLQVRGEVRPGPNCTFTDLKTEMELVARVLRTKAEIRDVVLDVVYRS